MPSVLGDLALRRIAAEEGIRHIWRTIILRRLDHSDADESFTGLSSGIDSDSYVPVRGTSKLKEPSTFETCPRSSSSMSHFPEKNLRTPNTTFQPPKKNSNCSKTTNH